MNAEERELLKSVCKQRDRALDAIGRLVDSFWSAHHNHAFDAEDEKGEHKCAAGKSISDCFNGCPDFDKEGVCKGFDCPMGFHHRRIYERVREAYDILDERPVEKKPFDLARVPMYDPKKTYEVSPQWYARMVLCFLNGFRLDEDKKDAERAVRLGDAAASLVCIGFASFGLRFPQEVFTMTGYEEVDENDPRIKQFKEQIVPFIEGYADKFKEITDAKIDDREAAVRKDEKVAFAFILNQFLTFMGEFAFGRDYPSADLGIYSEVKNALKYDCVSLLRLPRESFDIIENINDEALDKVGYKEV